MSTEDLITNARHWQTYLEQRIDVELELREAADQRIAQMRLEVAQLRALVEQVTDRRSVPTHAGVESRLN